MNPTDSLWRRTRSIPIGLDITWFMIFGLITWMLAANYFPVEFAGRSVPLYWFMGAATAVMLFVCVVLHEMGHSAMALHSGIPVNKITLFLVGGVAQTDGEAPSAMAEFWIAMTGPLVSLILAFLFYEARPFVAGVDP